MMPKILVVDDVADNVKLLSFDLVDDGFEVIGAFNGPQALEQAESQRPDVILLDIMMPGMDGIETCKRLKSSRTTRHIPVIMVTALDQPEDIVSGFDAGAHDYITKPLDYRLVAPRVRSAARIKANQDVIMGLNESLASARATAEQASELKSQFLATMSHELRTPLNGVLGMTELLLSTQLDVSQKEMLELVSNSGHALLGLINDILDISKIEAGHMELEERPFVLHDSLTEVLQVLSPLAARKGVSLVDDCQLPLNCTLLGDSTRIKQVLFNLIGNALKFTSSGHVKISCELTSHSDGMVPRENPTLRIAVQDTGIGIPAARLDGLFDAFTQADASTARRFGGTGLGLTISRKLAAMMNGTLEASSIEGQGSTFAMSVRLAEAPPTPNAAKASQPRPPQLILVGGSPAEHEALKHSLGGYVAQTTTTDTLDAIPALALNSPETAHVLLLLDQTSTQLATAEQALRIEVKKSDQLTLLAKSSGNDGTWVVRRVGRSAHSDAIVYGSAPVALDSILCRQRDHSRNNVDGTQDKLKKRALEVLVVDDNEVNLKVATGMLKKWGCVCTLARDGQQALELLAKTAYPLVLMDCQMPTMDGLSATRQLRKTLGPNQKTFVCGVTAAAGATDREACVTAGMNRYISKPFSAKTLLGVVQQVVTLDSPQAQEDVDDLQAPGA